jgi:hypothetical protein
MAVEVQRLAKPFAVGLVMVVIVVGAVLYFKRGIEPTGAILKIRTQALDATSSIAVVDFRVENSSDTGLVIRNVGVSLEAKDGKTYPGASVSEVDAQTLFKYYPVLGQKFNDTLRVRDKIAAHQTVDRMIAARFEVPESQLAERVRLIVRVEDVDGPAAEIREK